MIEIPNITAPELYSADIFVVGLGTFALNQLTMEAFHLLRQAQQIVHLTELQSRLAEINPRSEDLRVRFPNLGESWESYTEVAAYVIDRAIATRPLVFAVTGNPFFFEDVPWEIVSLAKKRGLRVQAIPGVSCLDVLPIQLGFDPGDLGIQVFLAAHLVRFGLKINPLLSTLVLQIAECGSAVAQEEHLRRLIKHLSRFFPENHPIVFLKTRSEIADSARVVATRLNDIGDAINRLDGNMTLYIPRTSVSVGG